MWFEGKNEFQIAKKLTLAQFSTAPFFSWIVFGGSVGVLSGAEDASSSMVDHSDWRSEPKKTGSVGCLLPFQGLFCCLNLFLLSFHISCFGHVQSSSLRSRHKKPMEIIPPKQQAFPRFFHLFKSAHVPSIDARFTLDMEKECPSGHPQDVSGSRVELFSSRKWRTTPLLIHCLLYFFDLEGFSSSLFGAKDELFGELFLQTFGLSVDLQAHLWGLPTRWAECLDPKWFVVLVFRWISYILVFGLSAMRMFSKDMVVRPWKSCFCEEAYSNWHWLGSRTGRFLGDKIQSLVQTTNVPAVEVLSNILLHVNYVQTQVCGWRRKLLWILASIHKTVLWLWSWI